MNVMAHMTIRVSCQLCHRYLFKTIRDNGAREVLTEPGVDFKFPHNLYDAYVGEDLLIWRLIWDLLYQIIFIYILLASITGISESSLACLIQDVARYCNCRV